jgi:hypothetical protein
MSEFTPPAPPETLHELTIEEFLYNGKRSISCNIAPNEYFYMAKGIEIKHDKAFSDIEATFWNDEEFLIIKQTKIIIDVEYSEILLNEAALEFEKISVIFYKCQLPEIRFKDFHGLSWYFVNTHVDGGVAVGKHSSINDLKFVDNCFIRNATIMGDSKCADIMVSDNSMVAWIDIAYNSNCGDITVCRNSRMGSIDVSKNSSISKIRIDSNSQSGDIKINQNSLTIDLLILQNSKCKNIDVNSTSYIFQVAAEQNSEIGDLNINENSQVEIVRIFSSQSSFIYLQDSSQLTSLFIHEGSKNVGINVNSYSQIGNLDIDTNSRIEIISIGPYAHCGGISIKNSQVEQIGVTEDYCSFNLHNAYIPLCHLNNCFINQLIWQAGTRGGLYIDGGVINYISLKKTALLKDAVFSIIGASVHILQLQELLVHGQLIMRNIKPANAPFAYDLEIKKYFEKNAPAENSSNLEKEAYLNKISLLSDHEKKYNEQLETLQENFKDSSKPLLRIVDSSFGKTEITGCDLRGFNIEFCDSKLLDTFITGTLLPHKKVTIYPRKDLVSPAEKKYKEFEQKNSFYDQLKKISEQKGDVHAAGRFHSYAIYYQQKMMKWELDHNFLFDSESRRPLIRKISQRLKYWGFRLNKYSNNHGSSWVHALRATVIISGLIYLGYYTSVNYHKELSMAGADDFIGNYFTFFNPAHSLDFMASKSELNAFAKFFDFAGRILIGYCIYQFVVAFRRHGRG